MPLPRPPISWCRYRREFYALEGFIQLKRIVDLVQKKNLNPTLKISKVVLTMYDARNTLSVDVAEEVRRHFKNELCKTVIPRTVRLAEAPSFGQPITVFDPTSKGAKAYRALARRSPMARRPGLGKGLGALIPESDVTVDPVEIIAEIGPLRRVSVTSIRPNPFQPRKSFNNDSLQALASSVKELGVLQPIIVRPVDGAAGEFELIAGVVGARLVSRVLSSCRCSSGSNVNDRLSLEQAVVENLHQRASSFGRSSRLSATH